MPINRHFDLIAPWYDRMMQPPDPVRLRQVLDLPCPGWMLDAAGGTGRVAAQLSPLVGHLVIGDLSRSMLAQAASKDGLLPGQMRSECLPFADGRFERILVVDALHHFGDQTGVLRELARVLSPAGRLVIEEPDIHNGWVKLIALGETLLGMGSHFRAADWIAAQMQAAGLQARVETQAATLWVIGIKPHN